MPREVHEHVAVQRFVIGTVGLPGERSFYLQARSGSQITTVAMAREQVSILADRLADLLADVASRHGVALPDPAAADLAPLDVPLTEQFRVSAIAFGWDPGPQQMLFELHAASDRDGVDPTELDDQDEGPPLLRVRASVGQAVEFVERARRVLASGRPPCPLCQQPLDARGHVCPRANGYRR